MKFASIVATLFLVLLPSALFSQVDSTASKFSFEADFRFRIEQDWNSRKSDGTYRNDRTRLRYRVRAGVTYGQKWYSAGLRIRTGNPRKQQDPQLTLGAGSEEFGTLPIGLEKAYFQGKWSTFGFWLGKNTFPFEKSNELFWSDNVYPEGVFLRKSFKMKSSLLDSLDFKAGHFVMITAGQSFDMDSYFQGYQAYMSFFRNRVELFPSFYLFKNIPNIPDGGGTYHVDYPLLHVGSRIKLLKKPLLKLEVDYYHNLQDYQQNDSIPSNVKQQKSGMTVGLMFGGLKEKGDWLFKASYAHLQQFSIVDFMAQNDWARWDYSSYGSPDGRLTNYQGIELVAGYKMSKKTSLKLKYYMVEQLIPSGSAKENGNRIRLDLDVKF